MVVDHLWIVEHCCSYFRINFCASAVLLEFIHCAGVAMHQLHVYCTCTALKYLQSHINILYMSYTKISVVSH